MTEPRGWLAIVALWSLVGCAGDDVRFVASPAASGPSSRGGADGVTGGVTGSDGGAASHPDGSLRGRDAGSGGAGPGTGGAASGAAGSDAGPRGADSGSPAGGSDGATGGASSGSGGIPSSGPLAAPGTFTPGAQAPVTAGTMTLKLGSFAARGPMCAGTLCIRGSFVH